MLCSDIVGRIYRKRSCPLKDRSIDLFFSFYDECAERNKYEGLEGLTSDSCIATWLDSSNIQSFELTNSPGTSDFALSANCN
jgi:hypothetical protein